MFKEVIHVRDRQDKSLPVCKIYIENDGGIEIVRNSKSVQPGVS